MEMNVSEPKSGWNIRNDEFKSTLWAFSNTLFKEFFNREAGLHFLPIFSLPPSRRTMPSLDESLTKDMIKHVLQVREFVVLELELNELSGRGNLKMRTRSELVGKPEFSVSHFGREKDGRK